MTQIKICGLKREEDIEIVNKFCPDYIGFVFAPSKRQITLDQGKHLKQLLKPTIKAVGVFVNERVESILEYETHKVIDIIQLHGDEDATYIRALKAQTKLPLIKAIRVKSKEELRANITQIEALPVDYLLFDTYAKEAYGGSGISFDWDMLKGIQRPYFLAGGIGITNLEEALKKAPYGIDVSSSVEREGLKDQQKIEALMRAVRKFKHKNK